MQIKFKNKGFSLVELIITIAVMAALVGIVGTQVVPYLNRAKVAKDLKYLNAYSTAAVSAFSMNADAMPQSGTMTVNMWSETEDESDELKHAQFLIQETVKELVGNDTLSDLKEKMTSDQKDIITGIRFTFVISTRKISAEALVSDVSKNKLKVVESYL